MLVEAIVAIGILAVVVVATELGMLDTFSAAGVAKEHDVANNLATAAIDGAIALPFADLEAGLNPSADSLANDPEIRSAGSGSYTLAFDGAALAATNTNTSEAPLVPHLTNTVNAGISYQVATYPTTNASDSGVVNVVVIVTWTSEIGQHEQFVSQAEVSAP